MPRRQQFRKLTADVELTKVVYEQAANEWHQILDSVSHKTPPRDTAEHLRQAGKRMTSALKAHMRAVRALSNFVLEEIEPGGINDSN